MNRRNRSRYGLLLFVGVGVHLFDIGSGPFAWMALVLQFLVYPQVVYWRARHATDQRAAELGNLAVDATLLGVWAAALGFPVWITFIFLVSAIINMTVFRGRWGFIQAFAWATGGAGLAVLAGGLHFHPQTSWPVTLLCISAIAAYVFTVADSAYTRALQLHATREQLRASQQELLRQLAANTSLQEQLRDQANHDPLTGLYNRRYLDDNLARELIRCKREQQPLSLVLIDIDHFKQINDAYGHLAGDQVLKHLAAMLGAEVRGSDIACRYGGEEFLLMLPGLPQDVAHVRAEEWRSAFAASPITLGDGPVTVTWSAGIATFPANGATAEELFRAADNALYQAKRQGRNRVQLADPLESTLA
ncbi:sensor domain-containing diguanylate cyclase [Herbaspirillum sp. ST 5-3]|uniref:sensor domain-containing diguanylate cyclase n=1 Tax=Oxalobacteraceae TaxID=75682 RepID=UPI001455FE45|nr:sensor domain-containing diguanylate cyclase [Herbaspirillum sp. ST 5-3]